MGVNLKTKWVSFERFSRERERAAECAHNAVQIAREIEFMQSNQPIRGWVKPDRVKFKRSNSK